MDELHNQMNVLKTRLESLAKDYFGPQFLDEAKDYVLSHPFIAVALLAIAVMSSVPVMIFLCFATVTVIVALIAFVCIEGSIIVIGGLILIGVISFITLITVGFTSTVAVAYWSAQKIHFILCHSSYSKNTRQNNLSSESHANRSSNKRATPAQAIDGNIAADSNRNDAQEVSENYEFIG